MLIFRKLDKYVLRQCYNCQSETGLYEINTIIDSKLIYECQSNWFYGRIIMQGYYLVSLTLNGYFIDVTYLHKKFDDLYYCEDKINERGYLTLYWHDNYQLKLFESNSILCINKKIWEKISRSFKYIKYIKCK